MPTPHPVLPLGAVNQCAELADILGPTWLMLHVTGGRLPG
jgi:hypothetical protein